MPGKRRHPQLPLSDVKGDPVGADRFLPGDGDDLGVLRQASANCQGCGLFVRATQTVFGEGDLTPG